MKPPTQPQLPVLRPGDPFPPASAAWGRDTPAPGLLAAGGALDVPNLLQAYASGIFPWFGPDQPILWWSPDPRMVLDVQQFRLHRSLRKTLQRFRRHPACEIRVDTAFGAVIRACATAPRRDQTGTWITTDMILAYEALHAAGHAHSVETWIDGQLVGGLYVVAIGRSVFGESMFARVTDASKIALSALVALCRAQERPLIDCQQNTAHLASLGAREIPRTLFLQHLAQYGAQPAPAWEFNPVYWNTLLDPLEASS